MRRAASSRIGAGSEPRTNVKRQPAERIGFGEGVGVVQIRQGRKIGFKLQPVKPLHLLLSRCFDKHMQFAISDAKERPSIHPDVLHGRRQFDPYLRISLGRDQIRLHATLGPRIVTRENSLAEQDDNDEVQCVFHRRQGNVAVSFFRGHSSFLKHRRELLLLGGQLPNRF